MCLCIRYSPPYQAHKFNRRCVFDLFVYLLFFPLLGSRVEQVMCACVLVILPLFRLTSLTGDVSFCIFVILPLFRLTSLTGDVFLRIRYSPPFQAHEFNR